MLQKIITYIRQETFLSLVTHKFGRILNAGKSVKLLLSGEWLHTHTHIIMIAYWPCSGHTNSLVAMVRPQIRNQLFFCFITIPYFYKIYMYKLLLFLYLKTNQSQ